MGKCCIESNFLLRIFDRTTYFTEPLASQQQQQQKNEKSPRNIFSLFNIIDLNKKHILYKTLVLLQQCECDAHIMSNINSIHIYTFEMYCIDMKEKENGGRGEHINNLSY